MLIVSLTREVLTVTTEEKIIATFLTLLKQEDYAQINVTQLMRHVHLTRTYFYQLFADKRELAREAFFSLVQEYLIGISRAITVSGQANLASVRQGMTFVAAHKEEMRLLMRVQTGHFNLLVEFQDRIKAVLKARIVKTQTTSPRDLDYFLDLFTASTVTTLNWFLTHDDVSTDDMIRLVNTSLSCGISALL